MTPSINEQLNIPILPDGTKTYQPDLFGANFESGGGYGANANVVVGTAYYSRADGKKQQWGNCCGNFIGNEAYNYADGNCSASITASSPVQGVVACVNGRAIYVPHIWAVLKATKKGREKIEHNRCVCIKKKEAKKPNDVAPSDSIVDDGTLDTKSTSNDSSTSGGSKMSTGAIIGLSIGGVVLVGGIIYLIRRNATKK